MAINPANASLQTLDLLRMHFHPASRGVTIETGNGKTILNILVIIPRLSTKQYELLNSTFRTAVNAFGIVDKKYVADESYAHDPRSESRFMMRIVSDHGGMSSEELYWLENTFDSVLNAIIDHTERVVSIANA